MTQGVAQFADLLRSAVTDPGIVSGAYRAFHRYSIGNQLLAWSQCVQRGITPGPIATFMGWKEKGRYVRKGEKAITLCRPVTVKRTTTADDGTEDTTAATWFVYKAS
jgi:antirestriction protein ArdC